MPEEIIVTQVVESGAPPAGPNETPQLTPELQAEVERLARVRAQELKREEFDEQTKKSEEKALYWRKEKTRERDDYFKGRRQPGEPEPPKVPSQDLLQPPRKEDFDDYDKYVEAVTEYKTDLKIAKWEKDQAERIASEDYQRRLDDLKLRVREGYKLYPDFEDVALDQTVPITMVITDILMETEHPAEIAYYLGKNRTEAIQIARMTPFKAQKEILRIESEILRQKEANKGANQNSTNIISKAPPPIKPVGSSGVLEKDPAKMTQAEFEEWRKSQGARNF